MVGKAAHAAHAADHVTRDAAAARSIGCFTHPAATAVAAVQRLCPCAAVSAPLLLALRRAAAGGHAAAGGRAAAGWRAAVGGRAFAHACPVGRFGGAGTPCTLRQGTGRFTSQLPSLPLPLCHGPSAIEAAPGPTPVCAAQFGSQATCAWPLPHRMHFQTALARPLLHIADVTCLLVCERVHYFYTAEYTTTPPPPTAGSD